MNQKNNENNNNADPDYPVQKMCGKKIFQPTEGIKFFHLLLKLQF